MTPQELEDFIFNYPTKHKEGFRGVEMIEIINKLNLDIDNVYSEMGVNTCMMIGGEMITYHIDFYRGLRNVMFNQKTSLAEWD